MKHLLPHGMLLLKLVDDARNRASNVRLANRAVDSTIAAYALFASDAKGAEGFVRVYWAHGSQRFGRQR